MKIKITDKNREKIQALPDTANGRASDHTYRDYEDLAALVTEAEGRRAHQRMSKHEATGMRLDCTSGDSVPRAYKWSRNATRVELTSCATGWCLTALDRATIYSGGGGLRTILTPTLDGVVLAKFKAAQYTVRLPPLVR